MRLFNSVGFRGMLVWWVIVRIFVYISRVSVKGGKSRDFDEIIVFCVLAKELNL